MTSFNSGLRRPHIPWAFIFYPALSQELERSSSAHSRPTDFQITSSKRPRLIYQTPTAPTESQTLPLPACQLQRRRANRHVPQVASATHAPGLVPAPSEVRKEAPRDPLLPAQHRRGKEKRTGKPACQEREKGPEPSHCSSKLGSPLRSLRTRPRERSSPGRRRNSAALARGPPIELACSLAASARPSAVPAPQSPNRVRDRGRARPRPRRVHPPASLSPAPWYPGSGPSSRSPLAPAQVPARAELRLPARPEPLERTLAPARNKEIGGALPAPVPGRAAARSVPRGDGRSRQGSEQRKQRAGGPVLLAHGRARRRAPSRRHGQSPPPRPGRPVTWPHRPNNAARSRRAPGPVRLWDLPKLARWNRELLDPLSSPDSKCSGGWCVPDGQAIS